MNFIERFSLLLLEPGEIYFCDNAACYRLPYKETNAKEGWETKWFQEEIRGRLMICSKSLVFDPRVKQLPLFKFPLKHCSSIKVLDPLASEVPYVFDSKEGATLEVKSAVTIEMLENNVIKPYKFRKTTYTHYFILNFTKASDVLPLINQLQRASTLPTNDHNFMIEAIVRSLQNRIIFNYTHVKDPRETKILELKACKVTPLVKNPGRILITDCALYYQPFNNIEKDLVLHISFANVKQVIKRRFLLRHVGLEIFYKERNFSKYLYLIFKEPEERDEAYKCLMQQENLEIEKLKLENMTYKWHVGEISNYDYLMYLNSEADRSVNDLTQYPVFPWVIADYESENLDLSNPGVFRDLTKPVGALNEERLLRLKERYIEMGDPKFLYGSHYSTPGFVLFYLVRKCPLYMLCLHNGKFDHPDRMFNSISASWDNVTTNASDFKELIPEFYDTELSGEFLKNEKAIFFGTRQCGDPVWDVSLPPWAKDSIHFIKVLRSALESDYVSYNLHHWIDLIFGYKQKGEEAVKADNIFYHLCYEGAVDLSSITDLQEKISMEVQIMEFGQIPKQLFKGPHVTKSRNLCMYNDGRFLSNIQKNVGSLQEESLNKNEMTSNLPIHLPLYSNLKKISKMADAKLHRNAITHVMFIPNGKVIVSLGKDGFLKAYSYPSLTRIGNLNSGSLAFSSCVYLPGTTEVLIGCWDNYLYRFNYKLCQKKDGLQAHSDAISCMDINSEVLVTGSWDCLVRVWDLTKIPVGQIGSGWSTWRLLLDHLAWQIDHDSPVNCVTLHPHDQLLASATTDGFINNWHLKKDIRFLNVQVHKGLVNGLVWGPNGGSIASCGDDGAFALLDADSGKKISSFVFTEALKCMLFDGRIAILGGNSGFIFFFDAPKSEILLKLKAHEGPVTAIALSPNHLTFVTGGEEGEIALWGYPDEELQESTVISI